MPLASRLPSLAALLVLLCCGCGQDDRDRADVSGSVSYLGDPVASGDIRFIPVENTALPTSVAAIRDGDYTTSSKGGVPAGTYRVEIAAHRNDSSIEGVQEHYQTRVQYLPPKYHTHNELQITIPPGGGSVVHDFDLTDSPE